MNGPPVDLTWLVTGANGFIGKRLVGALRTKGCPVRTIGSSSECDLSRAEALRDEAGVDIVVHLAGRVFVPAAIANPAPVYTANVDTTLQVLEYARRCKPARLVYLSSFVYGQPQYLPIDEAHPVQPTSPYNRSKWLAEQLVQGYVHDAAVPAVILRLFNAYGPHQDERFLIPTILTQILGPQSAIELDTLEPRRDYVFVDDVVTAIVRAATTAVTPGAVFNVASGQSWSVREIVDIAQAVAGTHKPVISRRTVRPGEIAETRGDVSRIAAVLGWQPSVSLELGLRRTCDALRDSHVQR